MRAVAETTLSYNFIVASDVTNFFRQNSVDAHEMHFCVN